MESWRKTGGRDGGERHIERGSRGDGRATVENVGRGPRESPETVSISALMQRTGAASNIRPLLVGVLVIRVVDPSTSEMVTVDLTANPVLKTSSVTVPRFSYTKARSRHEDRW